MQIDDLPENLFVIAPDQNGGITFFTLQTGEKTLPVWTTSESAHAWVDGAESGEFEVFEVPRNGVIAELQQGNVDALACDLIAGQTEIQLMMLGEQAN